MPTPNSNDCSLATSPSEPRQFDRPAQMDGERDRDDDRLELWIRRHQGPTWRFVRLCGCPADLADDLVQEALLAALHKQIVRQPDDAAAAWLRGAVNNLWRMHLRTNARRERHLDAISAERTIEQARHNGDHGDAWLAALRTCLQSLDGRARRLLDLHYAAKTPRDGIAAAFGMRPDGIKTLLRRVRDALRQCVLRRLTNDRGDDR